MKESNCHILLILDNATSHIACALILNNVKILMLPKNVTSKIQLIDASIIASFKLYYRYMQLQCTIDRDEASIEDIEENLLVDPNDELEVKELQQQIDALGVHNPMPVEDLLNIEEEREAHHQFTDEDLIQAATEIEQEKNKIVITPLTGKEQLRILCDALRIVDERIDDSRVTIKSLHKLQSHICEKVQKEKAEKQVQLRLDQFFNA
ncbi:16326_t:CDS:2 [Dentiscutata heterogama]|uniref:16326_t:CDS:1 n=1 Tax=Dentiscutata heterogama TaxID=1316150 RepID=A0ACA9LN03_9GLOM|nr:16326_t:CDS:2 [Dentiscutata heterogama]